MIKHDTAETLRKRYPQIFSRPCEISTGDGWHNILDSLCGCIQEHIAHSHSRYASAVKFNSMADALVAGNDEQFRAYFGDMPPKFLQERRDDIMSGDRRVIIEPAEQVVAGQIKEKFGTLRFYYSGGDDHVRGLVNMAEAMSAVTCEVCGSPGQSSPQGWIKTLCPQHHAERQSR